jgi:hypothetical protein
VIPRLSSRLVWSPPTGTRQLLFFFFGSVAGAACYFQQGHLRRSTIPKDTFLVFSPSDHTLHNICWVRIGLVAPSNKPHPHPRARCPAENGTLARILLASGRHRGVLTQYSKNKGNPPPPSPPRGCSFRSGHTTSTKIKKKEEKKEYISPPKVCAATASAGWAPIDVVRFLAPCIAFTVPNASSFSRLMLLQARSLLSYNIYWLVPPCARPS